MKTHGLDLRTAADNAARMAERAKAKEDKRQRAEKLFRDEPDLTAEAIATRLGLTRSAVALWKREWRKRTGAAS